MGHIPQEQMTARVFLDPNDELGDSLFGQCAQIDPLTGKRYVEGSAFLYDDPREGPQAIIHHANGCSTLTTLGDVQIQLTPNVTGRTWLRNQCWLQYKYFSHAWDLTNLKEKRCISVKMYELSHQSWDGTSRRKLRSNESGWLFCVCWRNFEPCL